MGVSSPFPCQAQHDSWAALSLTIVQLPLSDEHKSVFLFCAYMENTILLGRGLTSQGFFFKMTDFSTNLRGLGLQGLN